MTTNVNTKTSTSSDSTAPATAPVESFNLSIAACSASLAKTLRDLQAELAEVEQTVETCSDEGASGSESSTSSTASAAPASSTSSGDVGSYSLAKALAGLMVDLGDEQSVIAKANIDLANNERGILDFQQKQCDGDYQKWKQDYADWEWARDHQSWFQKLTSFFSDAFQETLKAIDKYDPIYIAMDAVEDELFGGHFDLESADKYVNIAMDEVNYAIDQAAVGIGDAFGSKIVGDIVIAVALAIATTYCPTLLEADVEVAAGAAIEEGGAAALEEGGAAVADAGGEAAGGEAANGSRTTSWIKQKAKNAWNAIKKQAEKDKDFIKNLPGNMKDGLKTALTDPVAAAKNVAAALRDAAVNGVERSTSGRWLRTTYFLQQNNFAVDVAVACTNDPKKQAYIEMAVGVALALVSGIAANSYMNSFGKSNMFSTMQRLENLKDGCNAAGQAWEGGWGIKMAYGESDFGNSKADLGLVQSRMKITEEQASQAQQTLTSLITALSNDIASLGQSLPEANASAARVIA